MKTSESISKLAIALSKAQGSMGQAAMDSTNPFLKNRYASLTSVVTTCRAPLAENELSIIQTPTINLKSAPVVRLTTTLLHSSGEWVKETISLPLVNEKGKSTAQSAGSIITYLRRYALSAMLGIVADEDTDGNDPPENKKPRPKAKAPSDNGQQNSNGKKLMSSQKFVEYVSEKLGFKNPQHVRATMKLLGKKSVPQDTDLRKTLYEALEAYRDMRDDKKLTQDDALAALQDEPKETTKADTPV